MLCSEAIGLESTDPEECAEDDTEDTSDKKRGMRAVWKVVKLREGFDMSKARKWLVTSMVALMLLIVSCAPASPATGVPPATQEKVNADGYVNITVDELVEMLKNKDFSLVNVHVPYDGELPETDLFISYEEMEENLTELPEKDEIIVLYCRSESMSKIAAKTLVSLGYTRVMMVDGGMRAWESSGREILRR